MDVLLGDGIFNADGELWRKQRKTASFEFASKNLRDFSANVFREYALKLSDILCEASTDNRVIDMQVTYYLLNNMCNYNCINTCIVMLNIVILLQDLFMRMTLDSICKVGFGVEIGTLSPNLPDNSFAQAFDAANMIVTLRFIDPLWKMKRFLHIGSEALLAQSIKVVDEFTYRMIRKRKEEIEQARACGIKDKVIIFRQVPTPCFVNGLELYGSLVVYDLN